MDFLTFQPELKLILGQTTAELCGGSTLSNLEFDVYKVSINKMKKLLAATT